MARKPDETRQQKTEQERVEAGRRAAVEGFANEHIVVGLLMKRYHNVSLVDLPLSRYDIIIALPKSSGEEEIIRAQVKTVSRGRISFTGGQRGGRDRITIRGVTEYRQTTQTSDVVIGLEEKDGNFVLYFVPTCLIEELTQKSISVKHIQFLKENHDILRRCKDKEYVLNECRKAGILPSQTAFPPETPE